MAKTERIQFFVSESLKEKVFDREEERVSKWIFEALALGIWAENGRLFQKVGDSYLVLKLKDIDPTPTPIFQKKFKISLDVPSVLMEKTKTTVQWDEEDWIKRVFNLRLRAESLSLFVSNGKEFERLDVSVWS